MTIEQTTTLDDAGMLAGRWLYEFQSAVQAKSADGVADLFYASGSWRDVLALTGQVRTCDGPARVAELLSEAWSTETERTMRGVFVRDAQWVQRYNTNLVEAFFDFTTHVGHGRGLVRLRPTVDDRPEMKAWVLLTTLQSLDPELLPAQPLQPSHAVMASGGDTRTWLDHRNEEREYADREPAVLVVGSGQHGLAIAAQLRARDLDTLVIERLPRVGDNWRNRYSALKLHNDTRANHLPFLPFPSTWEPYTPKDKLANWFEFYAQAMDLNVWTGSEFARATFDAESHTWAAEVTRNGKQRVLQPSHIVMATGVSGVAFKPELPGLDRFAGSVTHSSTYVDGRPYTGQRVLVVGSGTSGHDVCQDLNRYGAAEITMMQRSPTTVVSLEPGCLQSFQLYTTGRPTEDADLINISGNYAIARQWLPTFNEGITAMDRELLEGLHAAGFETDLGEGNLGFVYKYRRRGGGYYIDVGCSTLIVEGRVKILQARTVAEFFQSGIRMRDGSTQDIDAVVLATGYEGIQEGVRRWFGSTVADRVGPVWGLNEEGELRNIARTTLQEGLWFMAGGFPEARIYSQYLAVQLEAAEAGIRL